MTDTNQLPPIPTMRPGDSHMESLIEAAIQGHASTREAMRWLVRQLVPATQPAEVTDDLVEKATVETFQKTGADLIPEVAATFARAILAHHGITAQAKKEDAMTIELKQAAQQVLDAFEAFGEADDFATLFTLTQKMNALRTAIQQAEAQQPATGEPVQADSSGHLRVIASLGAALRRLSFAAQTTGGTDGPDAELQSAIGQAEQALSLGGIGQALFATTEPVFTSRFGRVVLSGPREDVEFAVRHLPDVDDKTTTPQPSQAAQAESEPLTDTFVQTVPDKCDRILWHGRYLHLPIPSLISNAPSLIEKAIQQAEAKTEETVDFPAGAIVNGRTLIERIEAYPFEILCRGLRMCSDWHELRRCFEYLADYVSTHPAPGVPDALKDHQIAAMVNTLRDIARQFHGHDSLRERIANVLVPALKTAAKTDVRCEGCGYMTHHREHMGCVRAAKQFTHPAPGVLDVDFDPQDLREIERAMDDFADCGETDVSDALLLRGVLAGFLECTHFHVADRGALQDAIDAAMLTAAQAQKGQP